MRARRNTETITNCEKEKTRRVCYNLNPEKINSFQMVASKLLKKELRVV